MRAKDREVAESVFDKNKRREAEIESAMRQEKARHDSTINNMRLLRELRLQRDARNSPPAQKHQ
jgi:hypothetical protein